MLEAPRMPDAQEAFHLRHAAYVGIVVPHSEGFALLLQLGPFGYYVPPGGGVEKGESPREAAARELKQETRLVAELGDLQEVLQGTFDDPIHGTQIVTFYKIEASCFPEGVTPQQTFEASEFKLVTLREARELCAQNKLHENLLVGFEEIQKQRVAASQNRRTIH